MLLTLQSEIEKMILVASFSRNWDSHFYQIVCMILFTISELDIKAILFNFSSYNSILFLNSNLCEHAISRNSIVMSLSHEGHVRKGVSDISLVVWGPFLKSPGKQKGLKPYFNINKLTQLYLYCSSITLPFLFSLQQIIGEWSWTFTALTIGWKV